MFNFYYTKIPNDYLTDRTSISDSSINHPIITYPNSAYAMNVHPLKDGQK